LWPLFVQDAGADLGAPEQTSKRPPDRATPGELSLVRPLGSAYVVP